MTPLLRKVSWLLQRGRKEAELDEELQFHLEEEAEERANAGLSAPEARRAARISFGNLSMMREDTRATWT